MTNSAPNAPTPSVETLIMQHMALINRLCLKAFDSTSKDALIFTILNDTVQVVKYDRAVLWDFTTGKPKLLGISGQTTVNKNAKLTKQWIALVHHLKDPKSPQQIMKDSFEEEDDNWTDYHAETNSNVAWLPIFYENELVLGLWIEGFSQQFQPEAIQNSLKILMQYLTPAYGSAWKHFFKESLFRDKTPGRGHIVLTSFALLLALFIIRVPLRVVAPCQVIPNNPFVVTAPLEGIIEKIDVKPGQLVKKDDLLYEYDKRLPMRLLASSEKQVEILEEEVKRAKTLGLNDPKSLTELSILALKLEKEKITLSYVQWQTTQLDQKASIEGVVTIQSPDEWRGKPVKVGERIMSINDPSNTKVKIWIPEEDNIVLDPEKPIKIILNIDPARTYDSQLDYVANEASLSDLHIPSFVAETKWITPPPDSKLGLEGTAILYGEKVSLFYFLIRKPLAFIRHKTGL